MSISSGSVKMSCRDGFFTIGSGGGGGGGGGGGNSSGKFVSGSFTNAFAL